MLPADKFVQIAVDRVREGKRVAFRQRQQVRYDLYSGHYRPHIVARLKALCPETWDQFQPLWVNLYRKVIDRRAGVFYKDPPVRTYIDGAGQPVSPDALAKIQAMLSDVHFSRVMDKAARYLESHKTIAVAAVWRHERIDLDVLAPMNFDILPGYPDPADADDADAFIHIREGDFVIWTRHGDTLKGAAPSFFVVNEKAKIVQSFDNPYAVPGEGFVYPFAVLQAEDPDTDAFIPGGDEVTEAALHVAFTLTDDAFIQRFQSFGQPVFRGVSNEVAKTLILSPSEGIGLPDPAMDLEYKSPGNSPEARMTGLQNFLTVFASSVDLPADVFVPNTLIPESGIAKRIASGALTEYRQRFAARLALHEAEVFETARAVWNTHAAPADRIPWDVRVHTRHAPVTLFFDALEADTRTKERVANNLETWQEVIARERNVTIEEADQILQRNKAANGAASTAPASAAPAAPGAVPAAGTAGIGAELRTRMEQRRKDRQAAAEAGATGGGSDGTT
jgi:hypothetical protein